MTDHDFLIPAKFPYVGLYSTANGISAVGSPVKVKILELLSRQEMAFDKLVQNSGRAKSTISIHLKDLAEAGIIDAKPDPEDGRKKIFYLHSLFLGGWIQKSVAVLISSVISKKSSPVTAIPQRSTGLYSQQSG